MNHQVDAEALAGSPDSGHFPGHDFVKRHHHQTLFKVFATDHLAGHGFGHTIIESPIFRGIDAFDVKGQKGHLPYFRDLVYT